MSASKPLERRLNTVKTRLLGSVETVTIPATDYAELLAAARQVTREKRCLRRSPIDMRPELRAFIIARLGKISYAQIAADCRRVFGAGATSKSAVDRFAARYAMETASKSE
jgi:hypothetical protein